MGVGGSKTPHLGSTSGHPIWGVWPPDTTHTHHAHHVHTSHAPGVPQRGHMGYAHYMCTPGDGEVEVPTGPDMGVRNTPFWGSETPHFGVPRGRIRGRGPDPEVRRGPRVRIWGPKTPHLGSISSHLLGPKCTVSLPCLGPDLGVSGVRFGVLFGVYRGVGSGSGGPYTLYITLARAW